MKSQIALLGIGVVIAAGVAYVELKPAANEPVATVTSTPTADSVVSQAPAAVPTSNTSTKIATPVTLLTNSRCIYLSGRKALMGLLSRNW